MTHNPADAHAKFLRRIEDLGNEGDALADIDDLYATKFVYESLATSWIAAQAIFGDHATPEHAFAIYAATRDVAAEDEVVDIECHNCGELQVQHEGGLGKCMLEECTCKKFVLPK